MKIIVKSNDSKNINIHLPMFVITTALKFIDISKYDSKMTGIDDDKLKYFDKESLIKALKHLKKHHKGLVLVEVDDGNGEYVKIEI